MLFSDFCIYFPRPVFDMQFSMCFEYFMIIRACRGTKFCAI